MSPIAECLSCREKSVNFDSEKQAEEWARKHCDDEWKKAGFPSIRTQQHTSFRVTGGRGGRPYGYNAACESWVYQGQEGAERFKLE